MSLRESFQTNGWRYTLSSVYVAAFLLLVLGLFAFLFFQRFGNDAPPYRMEYEGIVIDKSLTIHETQMGSGAERLLLIKDDRDAQFDVVVTREVYDRAKIGMRIKRTKDGTVLTNEK